MEAQLEVEVQAQVQVQEQVEAYGDEEVREHAKELFQNHVDGSAPIPGSMRGAVYKAVMTTATQTTYVQFKNLFRETESAEERSRILAAFGYCEYCCWP